MKSPLSAIVAHEEDSMTPTKKLEDPEVRQPSPSFLRKIELQSIETVGKTLGIERKPKAARLVKLSPLQQEQIQQIEEEAICDYSGDLTQIEAALGMLRMGHYYGWRVLYLIHSKKTIRNYEEILNIKIRDVFEETGPNSYRSIGFTIAKKFSNFWKVVGGDIKIPRKQDGI